MIYLILKSPAPLVRTLCKPVTDFGKSLDCLVADLFETLGHSERPGIGLSANQVGDLRRVFVVGDSKSFAAAAFVNPGITKSRGSKTAMEGCLSLKPEDDRPVTRAEIINWTAQDLNGKRITGKASGLLARVIQHEIDHLDGILIIDREKVK